MRYFTLLLLSFTAWQPIVADESDSQFVRAAVTRAVPWLEKDMIAWREANQCAACHHGPMYVWSMHLIARQGYAVDRKQLQAYSAWMIDDAESRVFPAAEMPARPATELTAADRMTAAMMGRRKLSQPTIYLAHALNALPNEDPLRETGWRKLAEHWSAAQLDDGSLAGRKGWPPIFNTPQILTLFATTALQDHRVRVPASSEVAAALAPIQRRMTAFLSGQIPDATHQGLVLRLLSSSGQGTAPAASLVDELLALQRADGGWSQTTDRPSDAFATGQSLYALFRSGVPSSHEAVGRGLDFLVRTQAADGTWPMTSRPNPETGKPAENLNPITYAAAAWATIGMTSYVAARP